MGFLKRVGGFIGFMLFLTPCIIAGIYAGKFNTASTLAGWGVGIGVAAVEVALILFVAGLAEKNKRQENLKLALGLLIVGVLPAGYWIGMPLMAVRPFKAHLPEYLAAASAAGQQLTETPDVAPLKGKLIPVDVKSKAIDPVFFDLVSDLRPGKPEEIGTIAALWWEEEQIGTYGGKGGAYQEHCTVMVLDKTTGTLLASKSFTGSMPPSKSQNGASQTGDKPYREIREFLNGLPHHS